MVQKTAQAWGTSCVELMEVSSEQDQDFTQQLLFAPRPKAAHGLVVPSPTVAAGAAQSIFAKCFQASRQLKSNRCCLKKKNARFILMHPIFFLAPPLPPLISGSDIGRVVDKR